ncbi:MAG: hypothetical protein ACI8RD_010236 [Bacillariaceae sp.]|jgi:hypothetical protein
MKNVFDEDTVKGKFIKMTKTPKIDDGWDWRYFLFIKYYVGKFKVASATKLCNVFSEIWV